MTKPKRRSVKKALKKALAPRRPAKKAAPKKKLSFNQLKAQWRVMHIKEHRNALVGIENRRSLMGDAWADAARDYRLRELKKLGAKP